MCSNRRRAPQVVAVSFASLRMTDDGFRMTALFPFFNKLLTVEITITGYQVTFRASWISRAGVPVEVIKPAPGTGFPSWSKRLILLRG